MATSVRLIKKYPNRRLYDTQTSTYITLADVKQLVLEHEDFQVIDAKSSDDLTRQILLQIILEEEAGGLPMFTAPMLSHIIRLYGNAMQGMMGSYLEKNIQAFIDIQGKLQEQSKAFYETNKIGPEMWTQFVNMQAPMIQSMMSSYIEQSKDLFVQMQENMQKQARSMFSRFPRLPGRQEVISGKTLLAMTVTAAARRPRANFKPTAPSVGFVSLGCPKALVDSELIITQLRAEGYATSASYGDADLVIVNTCGFIDAAVKESLDAIGEALAENGKVIVTGCLGAKKEGDQHSDRQDASQGARGHRAARDRRGARSRASAPAAGRTIRSRSRSAGGHQADAAPLRLPEDFRRLQPSLQLLHHSIDARRSGVAADRRRDARSRKSVEAGRAELLVISQDTSAYGVDVKYQHRVCRRPTGADADDRPGQRAGATRAGQWRVGAAALRVSVSARRRDRAVDGRRQSAAVSGCAVSARASARAEGDEAAGVRREEHRANPRVA